MSTDPEEFGKKMVQMVRTAETLMGRAGLDYAEVENTSRNEFRRSIVAKKNALSAGTEITKDKIAYKRPGTGLKPYQRNLILGKKKLTRNMQPDEKITLEDVE